MPNLAHAKTLLLLTSTALSFRASSWRSVRAPPGGYKSCQSMTPACTQLPQEPCAHEASMSSDCYVVQAG